MQRPIDVLVTGFTKSPGLLARSLTPLRRLKREGLVRSIHCVTWDSPELDSCVAPLQYLPEIQLTRVPQPEVSGGSYARTAAYQIENLRAALTLVPDDALILKWRPDFVAKYQFLHDKLTGFDSWSAVPSNKWEGVVMPPHLFQSKLWIPWADSNSLFLFEDAVFMGTRRDVEKMVTPLTPADIAILADETCRSYAHAMRYGKLFVSRYPLLDNYLKRFHCFPMELDHRLQFVPHMVQDGFAWHLIVAHAWILHSQFHVDMGEPDDLAFYANAVNRNADWSRFETLEITYPYCNMATWREGTKPGAALPSVCRAFGRLMDDSWQQALFTTEMPDLPRETLIPMMENIARCRDRRLAGIEAEFYKMAERVLRAYKALALAG